MTKDEIHIMDLPGPQSRRLYYFQGNFFHPMELPGAQLGLVRGAIRRFMKEHAAMVAADRADPAYRTLVDLVEAVPS